MCLKIVSAFKHFVTLSNRSRFSNFCTAGKHMKLLQIPHNISLRHVATLRWEIKIQIFCRYSADMEEKAKKLHSYRLWLCYSSINFDNFGVSNSEFSLYRMQIKFSSHCPFTCLLLRSICGTGNSSQQTSLQ